jgi:hypothetical protein
MREEGGKGTLSMDNLEHLPSAPDGRLCLSEEAITLSQQH